MNPSSAAQFAGPSHSTVASLFAARAHERPGAVAIREDAEVWTYAQTSHRVRRLAGAMRAAGIGFGDRVAVLSENRHEYLETFLAAAWLGAIVACQNWRLAPPELEHCLTLVKPKLVVASSRHVGRLEGRWSGATWLFEGLGPILDEAEPAVSPVDLDPEAPLIVLYTSGTTGRPKGAVISHRAEIARNRLGGHGMSDAPRTRIGLTPTVITARLTYTSAPEAMQGAVAAGLCSVGSLFVGTMEGCAQLLRRIVAAEDGPGEAASIVSSFADRGERLPGFGHPLHKPDDPRTPRLLAVAEEAGVKGAHAEALTQLSTAVDAARGRHLTVNATGAIAAVLLDCGVPAEIVRGFALVSRAAGLVGHIHEEQTQPTLRALWGAGEAAVPYVDEETDA